jgi:hypothetical protein
MILNLQTVNMSLNTLRSLSPERSRSPALSISSDSTTFSFKDNPFTRSILKEIIEPSIKQEVLDSDRYIERVSNKYIKSLNNKDKMAESITTVFYNNFYYFNKLEDIKSILH